jgi:hypothetical protein
VSILLYGVYAAFVVFASRRSATAFRKPSHAGGWNDGWLAGGLTYAGYNIVGAVVILRSHAISPATATPSWRASPRAPGDAAGIPLLHMHVRIRAGHCGEALPSDYLLARLDQPWFRYLFQIMIFAALLESGTGAVHAVNERISTSGNARTRNHHSNPPGARRHRARPCSSPVHADRRSSRLVSTHRQTAIERSRMY